MANPPKHPTFDWEMFRYIPSLVGAVLTLVAFTILMLLQFWQWLRVRNHIIIYVIIGTLCEMGGYGARIGSHLDNTSWAPFIIQGTLLLIGPLFFAATIYMMLGRTIRLAGGEDVSLIKPNLYSKIFATADITRLIVQGLGASIMGTMKLHLAIAGEKIVIAGLALQVTTFVIFLVASIDFHIRMNRNTASLTINAGSKSWKRMLWILYSVSSLILFRCIFRLIEYAMGNAAYPIAHEWTLYVFDTVPMFLVLVLLLILQPTNGLKLIC
ncbi:RTA1-domain-containing protein [Byssothecium circinans]|uniref:RTA1-domain-containing protein n=1 Tax=Byssothecium circinans TaxID=147558 RepID=A0A6A5U495_9PLEO|nr:RTA1-domain-containing protein [Byssothecium circinans]